MMYSDPDPRVKVTTVMRRRRRVKRAIFLWLPAIICLLALLAVLGIYDISAPVRYRWQLTDRLKSAPNRDAMTEAVGRLGVVLDHPDGSWIAITYKDAHNFGLPSVAVALTSDGRWFDSDRHHCGLFMTYNSLRADQIMMQEIGHKVFWQEQNPRILLLHQLENEADSDRRNGILQELGFDVRK
jgi:hypothetical protein